VKLEVDGVNEREAPDGQSSKHVKSGR
jgi:hypothetical protein